MEKLRKFAASKCVVNLTFFNIPAIGTALLLSLFKEKTRCLLILSGRMKILFPDRK
jgi:hypothetical protein